jgi:hypothetical protein
MNILTFGYIKALLAPTIFIDAKQIRDEPRTLLEGDNKRQIRIECKDERQIAWRRDPARRHLEQSDADWRARNGPYAKHL